MTTSLISERPVDDLVSTHWPELEGRQEPEWLLVDDGDQSEAEKAITLAGRVGKAQLPWQEATLRAILTLEPDGLFTHPTSVVIAPRQNGKTLSAAELRIVFGAFARGETVVYSAQRWLTAKSIYLRIKRLVNSRPSLKRRAFGWLCSQGVAGFTVRQDDGSENVVMFITRSGEFRGPDQIDLVIYDEAYNLTDSEMAAISPTQLAAPNPQTIYLSSSVNQEIHPNGHRLALIRHRALQAIKSGVRRSGTYFAEYGAPVPADDVSDAERRRLRENPATWKLANPSYGVIQTEAKVRKLLNELSEKSFEAELLGWGDWPPVGDGAGRLFNEQRWTSATQTMPDVVSGFPRVIGVDRSPLSKVWAIAGAQHHHDGRAHVEIGWCGRGSPTEVVERLLDVVAEADPAALVIDQRSPAAVLKPYLLAAGIEPVMTNTTDLAVACEAFYEAFLAEQITHPGQQMLTDSVTTAVKRELPGGRFAWGGPQIAALMAATLAHAGLLGAPTASPTAVPVMDTQEMSFSSAAGEREFDPMTAAF